MELTRRAFTTLAGLVTGRKATAMVVVVPDPAETRTLVKVYTTLTDMGTVFKMGGEVVPHVFKAEVFSDGFARLHTYSKPGAEVCASYDLDPYMCGVVTHILEGYPTIEPAEPVELPWCRVVAHELITMELCVEIIEVPTRNHWRRYVAGRMFVFDPNTFDVGLVGLEPMPGTLMVHWLAPHSREYEDGLANIARMRRNSRHGRRWQAEQARRDVEDLTGRGGSF